MNVGTKSWNTERVLGPKRGMQTITIKRVWNVLTAELSVSNKKISGSRQFLFTKVCSS